MKKLVWCLSLVLTLSSCKKFINWGKWTFNQGCKVDTYALVPREHIRSVRVYDQFNTISLIDGMWLSDAVRSAYVDLYAQKNYFGAAQKDKMLDYELQKNDKTIGFYILLWQQAKCGAYLDKSDAYWKIVMNTEQGSYQPRTVKKIDLPCEYVIFFGKRNNNFQKVFYVEFDALTHDGQAILEHTSYMTLCFSSLYKKTFLRWDIVDGKMFYVPKVNDCDDWEKCDNCKDLTLE